VSVRPGAEAGAGAFLLLLGPAFIVVGLKFHRRKYTIAGLTFLGGVVFFLLMPNAQSQTQSEQIFYYHNDHLGTPRVLTDQTGAVVWDVDYAPFGDIANYVINTLPVDQPFRFPGQYQDTMTGLYYNWNRYYMPETGRYNRVDISDLLRKKIKKDIMISFEHLDIDYNLDELYDYNIGELFIVLNKSYIYSINNPINYIDPNGLLCVPVTKYKCSRIWNCQKCRSKLCSSITKEEQRYWLEKDCIYAPNCRKGFIGGC
jgi:RHS repeat-associated protein